MRLEWRNEKAWCVLAVLAWSIAITAISCRLCLQPHSHNLYETWSNAGATWMAGELVYSDKALRPNLDQYRYAPVITVLFVPWTYLPDSVGMLLWRFLNLVVLLGGAWLFLQLVVPWQATRLRTAVFFLLILPLSVGSLNNGQINPLMTGLVLLGVALAGREWWWSSCLCLVLAVWIKPYVIAIALLMMLMCPRVLVWRFLVLAVAGFLLPFASQDPSYVWEQYGQWVHILRLEDRKSRDLALCYRDFWLLCRAWHIPMTRGFYAFLQGATAIGTACLVAVSALGACPKRQALTALLAWGCCWIMLFGPATESSTYVLLAPTMACAVLDAWLNRRSHGVKLLVASSFAILTGTLISCWFPQGSAMVHSLGLHPLATVLLTLAIGKVWVQDLRHHCAWRPLNDVFLPVGGKFMGRF